MKSAPDFDQFEAAWREVLNCIEKCWVKAERSCQSIRPKFEPWQATYHRLRKKDMLLRYLKQARDADNHSIQDLTRIEPGSRRISHVNSRGGHIKKMEIRNGQITHYEGDPIVMEYVPARLVAVPIKNGGEWFNPPTSHQDQPVNSLHPVQLAQMGIAFYEEYLNAIQAKFFSTAA